MIALNVFSLLLKKRKRQFPFLVGAMILGALFEIVGLGLVMPLIDIIGGGNSFLFDFAQKIAPQFSGNQLALLCVIVFMALFVIKGLYLSWLLWISARFSYAVKGDICRCLMDRYVYAPYQFHLSNNSAQLIRNVTIESSQVTNNTLTPTLTIIAESIVVIGVIVFLLSIEPVGTLIAASSLVLLSFAYHQFFSSYTNKLGQTRQVADGMVIQSSQEVLGGIKDVKILAREAQFLNRFFYNVNMSCVVNAKAYVLKVVPRIYLETVGVIVFSILLIFLIYTRSNYQEVISTLGVFGVAAFRLLPSANRIISALSAIRFSQGAVERLMEHLVPLQEDQQKYEKTHIDKNNFNFKERIRIDGLSFSYANSNEKVINDITLEIAKGESIGIVGKSGSGKTTLGDIIVGLFIPNEGRVLVDGVDIHSNLRGWQRLLGYVQQDIFLFDASLLRNITFGEEDCDIDYSKLQESINSAHLGDFIETLPDGLNTHIGERGVRLSGGQKQRLGIARAIYRDTPVLLFDEATSSLDTQTEAEIVATLKGLKGTRTIIIIAHRLSTIEHCDRVFEMKGENN